MATEKLEKLLAQRQVVDARIRREQGRERAKKRKDDTRRKILAGAAVLDEAEQKPQFKALLFSLLDSFLSRDDDRALFNLPALISADQGATKAVHDSLAQSQAGTSHSEDGQAPGSLP